MLQKVYKRFPLEVEMSTVRIHHTYTLNQFKFDHGKGGTACVAICIQALFHLNDALEDGGQLPSREQWSIVMERGIRVWTLWRERNPRIETNFPAIEEIITMKECEGFYNLFSERVGKIAGLAVHSELIDNGQGPLEHLVRSLTKIKHKTSCAIVILPHNNCVALICYKGNVLYFDSHGTRGSDLMELVQFSNPDDVAPYLTKRFDYDSADTVMSNTKLKKQYTDELLQIQFGYSAIVFTTK